MVFLSVFKAQTVFASVAAWLFIDIISGMKELTESEGSRYVICSTISVPLLLCSRMSCRLAGPAWRRFANVYVLFKS